jgi:hypothetical protein
VAPQNSVVPITVGCCGGRSAPPVVNRSPLDQWDGGRPPPGCAQLAWVCENHFCTEPNVQMAHSIETFAWDDDGNLLDPMPELVGAEADPYARLLEG